MTTTVPPSTEGRGGRTRPTDIWSDRVFRAVALTAGILVLVILGLIAFVTTQQAWDAFVHEGISFVTSTEWAPNEDSFGAFDFIYGTLVSSTIALLFAIPLS